MQLPVGHRRISSSAWAFTVWAPRVKTLSLELAELERTVDMRPSGQGFWTAEVEGLEAGALYQYVLDGETRRADPASHYQPQDVHGPSALVDHDRFAWSDAGFCPAGPEQMVLYELHVGCFTEQGTFGAALERLDHLAELGVTHVEVMPVCQFPGGRNWGYDGTYPYSVAHCYGGPGGFKRFVDGCHARGLAVILDVVYNHLGPEGNYLRDFGPYFTSRYKTPWGEAVNVDGPDSDPVNAFFIGNALHWLERYHVDGLRLDATHAIYDQRPSPFLRRLSLAVVGWGEANGKQPLLIAENDMNDPRLCLPADQWGMGMDGVWSDDFHHAVHALATGEKRGYYEDFGSIEHIATALQKGFCYTGQYSPFRRRSQGAEPALMRGRQHVACIQNHDQAGNRMLGERFITLTDESMARAAAGLLLLAPLTPLLFMGEEYGEEAPFLYFISHMDEGLVEAVRKGRKREFKSFRFRGEPPDPAAEETFRRSQLDWSKLDAPQHAAMLQWYAACLQRRRDIPALAVQDFNRVEVTALQGSKALLMRRWSEDGQVLALANLGRKKALFPAALVPRGLGWRTELCSEHGAMDAEPKFPLRLPGPCTALLITQQEKNAS